MNRFILHTSPLQPWDDGIVPGMTMGRWGTHFGRTQTWAESGAGWFRYLNRCQALLQWGAPAAREPAAHDIRPAGTPVSTVARTADGKDVVFVVNHSDHPVSLSLELPNTRFVPDWFDPVTGCVTPLPVADARVPIRLPACGSGFLVQRRPAAKEPVGASWPRAEEVAVVKGPWQVTFPGRGGRAAVEMKREGLRDWTQEGDSRIRYFSGTATYRTTFPVLQGTSPDVVALGDCQGQIARVVLNGVDCGTAWCPPYEVRIPVGALRAGANELAVEFTNVWANRLIGDEQEPPDCAFVPAPYPGGAYLARFPDWFVRRTPRPSQGRVCFTTWNYFTKDSPLVPSGLLGPVRLCRTVRP